MARWQPFAAGVFMIMDVFAAVESRFRAFDSAVFAARAWRSA